MRVAKLQFPNHLTPWNNHPLSTENNEPQMRVYLANSMESTMFNDPVDFHAYGQDLEGPTPESEDSCCPRNGLSFFESKRLQSCRLIN